MSSELSRWSIDLYNPRGEGRGATAIVIVMVIAGFIRGWNWALVNTVLSRLRVAAGAAASHY